MHQAIPYRAHIPATATLRHTPATTTIGKESVRKVVSENAVVVFCMQGCCMCHVVKSLLLGHGVIPAVFEVCNETDVVDELCKAGDGVKVELPAVFMGGKFFGGLESVMGAHISGELVTVLKKAGALWL